MKGDFQYRRLSCDTRSFFYEQSKHSNQMVKSEGYAATRHSLLCTLDGRQAKAYNMSSSSVSFDHAHNVNTTPWILCVFFVRHTHTHTSTLKLLLVEALFID